MKKLSLILIFALVLGLLAGCAGTPVIYYTDCTCPVGSHNDTAEPTLPPVVGEGAVKTGLYIGTDLSGSANAGEEAGKADFSVTVVAVNVDDAGVITACVIDSLGTSVSFDGTGAITSDLSAQILTKNELGADYGMVAWGGAIAEWDAQAAALANYAVGKTVEELRSGAVDETGHAVDADLATTATIYLGGYVAAVEKAVANAQHLGAQAGDELKYAVAIPFIMSMLGNIAGGYLTDKLSQRYGIKVGRKALGTVCLTVSAVCMVLAAFIPGKIAVFVFLSLCFGIFDLMLPSAWALCIDLGKHFAGFVSGAMNTFGNLGGFCCSLMFGYLLKSTGNYNLPLYMIAAMLLLSALLFAFINPSKPIVKEEEA